MAAVDFRIILDDLKGGQGWSQPQPAATASAPGQIQGGVPGQMPGDLPSPQQGREQAESFRKAADKLSEAAKEIQDRAGKDAEGKYRKLPPGADLAELFGVDVGPAATPTEAAQARRAQQAAQASQATGTATMPSPPPLPYPTPMPPPAPGSGTVPLPPAPWNPAAAAASYGIPTMPHSPPTTPFPPPLPPGAGPPGGPAATIPFPPPLPPGAAGLPHALPLGPDPTKITRESGPDTASQIEQISRRVGKVLETGADQIEAFGRAVARSASNEYMGSFIGTLEKTHDALKEIPVVGHLLAGAFSGVTANVRFFSDTVSAFNDRARQLAPLSGVLSVSQAHNEVRDILADIREAHILGPGMAGLSTETNELWHDIREMILPLKAVIIEGLTEVVKTTRDIIEWAKPHFQRMLDVLDRILEVGAWMAANMPLVGSRRAADFFNGLRDTLHRVRAETRHEEVIDTMTRFEELLASPPPSLTPVRFPLRVP